MIQNMYYINMMNIPTTIPTNETYWTNFPKQENPYAVPYTWWSSFKNILANIKPAGSRPRQRPTCLKLRSVEMSRSRLARILRESG